MTFSIPSPVELIQLVIQYQRKVGTASASNRTELGATTPAPGSTSRASTFLSLTTERLRERPPRVARARGLCANRGCPGHPPRGVSAANDAKGGEGAVSARPRARDRTRGRDHVSQGVRKSCVTIRPDRK